MRPTASSISYLDDGKIRWKDGGILESFCNILSNDGEIETFIWRFERFLFLISEINNGVVINRLWMFMQNLKDLTYEIKKNMTMSYLNSNFFSFQLFWNNEFFI